MIDQSKASRLSVGSEKEMRVIVTGGAGFIGSAICRHFVDEKGYSVLNIDKLTYAANLQSLNSISGNARYSFVRADVCDRESLDVILSDFAPNAVVHLAAESHVDRSITSSPEFIRTNVVGTHTLLEAVRVYLSQLSASGRDQFRFLHVSTDEVYGSLGAQWLFQRSIGVRPAIALFSEQGGQRSPCQGVGRNIRISCAHLKLLEQLRSLSFPRKTHSADNIECARRSTTAGVRRWPKRARLAFRRRPRSRTDTDTDQR